MGQSIGLLVFTRVAENRFNTGFKQRILNVYSLFPELHGRPIKCGFIRNSSRIAGSARSWTVPQQIAFQCGASSTTIAHELTHLLQGNGVPHGEKACDVWTMSRLPVEMADEQPYYLLSHWQKEKWLRHRGRIKFLCTQAIEMRRTDRAYIKWLSGQLRQLR